MKAFTRNRYGGPEVLKLEETERPAVKEGHILVKVAANSANPADWHIIRGKPDVARIAFGLIKPKQKIPGADFAGIVEEVGDHVSHFQKGDKVFGESLAGGAFAEYISIKADACGKMPRSIDFTQMACAPIAGLTALQALTTHGYLKKGESVLINGSSGGVGHFAVQVAKALSAEVTAVCSSRNTDFVKGLGADHAIAYDQEDIHRHEGRYDLVVDVHGNLNHSDFRRMGERGVLIGYTGMGHMIGVMTKSTFSKFPLKQFTAQANTEDLETLALMMEKGKVRVHIEKTYPYTEIPEAVGYIEDMRTRGKVAMSWE